MRKIFYDFHIHSCLSPCGDDDAAPADIAGMARLNGLDIAALTDHNAFANCPAFFEACEEYGVIPIAGCELTTAEDIHLICLFETLGAAMAFGTVLNEKRIKIRNKPQFFGNQLIKNADGDTVAEEEYLLPNATVLSIEEAFALAKKHGAVCYPAHIDRVSNGIVAVLGSFPEKPPFRCAEFNDSANIERYKRVYPVLEKLTLVSGSDAHALSGINGAVNFFEIDDGETDVKKAVFDLLRGEKR